MRRTALISSSFLGRVLAAGHLLAGAILGAALAPGQAYADCPATYAGLSCGALAPVCAVSSTTWTCNVTAGADIMRGGNDDDDMNGEDGNDSMSGNAGDDTMNGGLDNDILCGQAHTAGIGDVLYDGDVAAGVDTLWGNGSADDTCNSGNASTLLDNGCFLVGPGTRTGTAPTCP